MGKTPQPAYILSINFLFSFILYLDACFCGSVKFLDTLYICIDNKQFVITILRYAKMASKVLEIG